MPASYHEMRVIRIFSVEYNRLHGMLDFLPKPSVLCQLQANGTEERNCFDCGSIGNNVECREKCVPNAFCGDATFPDMSSATSTNPPGAPSAPNAPSGDAASDGAGGGTGGGAQPFPVVIVAVVAGSLACVVAACAALLVQWTRSKAAACKRVVMFSSARVAHVAARISLSSPPPLLHLTLSYHTRFIVKSIVYLCLCCAHVH